MNLKPKEVIPDPSPKILPVLFTKLYIPHHPPHLVSRERLMLKMSRALDCKLTLVTAPTGFGKTTMVSDWVHSQHIRAGWVSLDKGENDLLRFWGYVIAAFERLRQGTGKKALSLLQTPLSFSIDQMIAWLINDLFDVSEDLVVILDDFHVVESDEVIRSFTYFLERLPNKIHFCIISRKEPSFPVATMRVKGQLNQIGLTELKFTEKEISSFYFNHTGTEPNQQSVHMLANRTEGWAAGIHLAFLSQSMGQLDKLQHFSGNHRFVVDYLMEEVFLTHPEPIRIFLLQTSILGRMNEDICSAVTGYQSEDGMLPTIEQAGLFIIPLDAERHWYRYHHLFAEFLANRLMQDYGNEVLKMHARASMWFEAHGFMEEAIHHALSAEDYERAAALLQGIAVNLLRRRELTTLYQWLNQLPEEIIERPSVLIVLTWTELFMGHYELVKLNINKLKFALYAMDAEKVDMTVFSRTFEEVQILENFLAMLRGDTELAVQLIQNLLDRDDLPDGNDLMLSIGIELNEGTVPFIRGYYGFRGRIKDVEKYHQIYDAFIIKNRLEHFAFSAYQRVAMSEIHYELNHLPEALKYAEMAIGVSMQYSILGAYICAVITKSKVLWANQEFDKAIANVKEALEHMKNTGEHDTNWYDLLHTFLIRCYFLSGDIDPVDKWLEQSKINMDPEQINNQEFEWLTLLIINGVKENSEDIIGRAERLLKTARESKWTMTELETYICLSVLYERKNNSYESMLHLHQALTIGEREGYLRTFMDMPDLITLLRQYAEIRKNGYMPELQTGVSRDYLKVLLTAIGAAQSDAPDSKTADPASIHTLTSRETEVLQLIAEGLSNKDIAGKLVLTEGTVKLHLHRIYSKLQVKGRVQAIQKAKKDNLIP